MKGYGFRSSTDTEVIAILARYYYQEEMDSGVAPSFPRIVSKVLERLQGSDEVTCNYACLFTSSLFPNEMVVVKNGRYY